MLILPRRKRCCSLSAIEESGAGSARTASIRYLNRLRERRRRLPPKTTTMIRFHLVAAFGGC